MRRAVHRIAEAIGGRVGVGEVRRKLSKTPRQRGTAATITAAMQALAGAGYGEVATGDRGTIRYRATGGLP